MAQTVYNRESKEVNNIIMWAEDENLEVRLDYSGRGMYGKKCFGVVGSFNDFCNFMMNIGYQTACEDNEADNTDDQDFVAVNYKHLLGRIERDSMGLDSIFYFPSLLITEEDAEEEEVA